nr:hypothetical protein [uncultured Cupriavidus sp.]
MPLPELLSRAFSRGIAPDLAAEFPPVTAATRQLRLAAGQCFNVHLPSGAVVHVEGGHIVFAGAPRWLAGQVCQLSHDLRGGSVCVIDAAGWHQLVAQSNTQLRIVEPTPRPSLWRLIKSRFGRSGFLLGNARPPDTKAAEPSVPHVTSQ